MILQSDLLKTNPQGWFFIQQTKYNTYTTNQYNYDPCDLINEF